MATFTVNTTADVVDGNYSQLSLREAVNRANFDHGWRHHRLRRCA